MPSSFASRSDSANMCAVCRRWSSTPAFTKRLKSSIPVDRVVGLGCAELTDAQGQVRGLPPPSQKFDNRSLLVHVRIKVDSGDVGYVAQVYYGLDFRRRLRTKDGCAMHLATRADALYAATSRL